MPTPPHPHRNWCKATTEELFTDSDGEPGVELKKDLEKIRRKKLLEVEMKKYKEQRRLQRQQASDMFILINLFAHIPQLRRVEEQERRLEQDEDPRRAEEERLGSQSRQADSELPVEVEMKMEMKAEQVHTPSEHPLDVGHNQSEVPEQHSVQVSSNTTPRVGINRNRPRPSDAQSQRGRSTNPAGTSRAEPHDVQAEVEDPIPRRLLDNNRDALAMMAELGAQILRRLDEDRYWLRVQMEAKRVEVEMWRSWQQTRFQIDNRTNLVLADLARSQTLLAEALRRDRSESQFVHGSSREGGCTMDTGEAEKRKTTRKVKKAKGKGKGKEKEAEVEQDVDMSAAEVDEADQN